MNSTDHMQQPVAASARMMLNNHPSPQFTASHYDVTISVIPVMVFQLQLELQLVIFIFFSYSYYYY